MDSSKGIHVFNGAYLCNVSNIRSHLSPYWDGSLLIYPTADLLQQCTILADCSTHPTFWHAMRAGKIYLESVLKDIDKIIIKNNKIK